MKKYSLGILLGVIAGLVDISPMIAMKLPLAADLSAFSLWIVSGFLISASSLKIAGILKGVLTSFLVLLPCAILIGENNIADLIPVIIMTLALGSVLGYFIEK